jgi:phage shock protein PspC (stress-responsive transcriptional regulator)
MSSPGLVRPPFGFVRDPPVGAGATLGGPVRKIGRLGIPRPPRAPAGTGPPMFMPPSERSPNAPNHFHLAKEGRLLAGVCAGLAAYPGWMGANGWRAVFVIGALITTVPAAIAYAVMWKVMHDESYEPSRGPVWNPMHDESHEPPRGPVSRRERRQAPMPKVSWSMRRRIKRLVALVEEVRTRHDRPVGDLVLQTLDAIKLLAPRLQKPRTVRDERLAEAALVRFPALLEKLQAMSPDDVAEGSDPAVRTPGSVLRGHLQALHDGFNQEAARDVEAVGAGVSDTADGEQARTLHDRIRPLAARLGQSGAAASVATLDAIIAKLEFLLERAEGAEDGMDLRPFKVRRIAFEYLPQTLERYLQLPPELAGRVRIAAGRTAAQSLQDQLELLDARLGDLTRSYYEKDATALLVHGRFLRDTFGQGALRLDDERAAAPAPAVPAAPASNEFGRGAGRSQPPAPAATAPGTRPLPDSTRESARSLP